MFALWDKSLFCLLVSDWCCLWASDVSAPESWSCQRWRRSCANTWKKPVSSSRQIVVPEKVGCLSDNLDNLFLQQYEEIGGLMFNKDPKEETKNNGCGGAEGSGRKSCHLTCFVRLIWYKHFHQTNLIQLEHSIHSRYSQVKFIICAVVSFILFWQVKFN